MPRFVCEKITAEEDEPRWFAPKDRYDCARSFEPVKFEARCFFNAIEEVFSWCSSDNWRFIPGHEENSAISRVYSYDDEDEQFRVVLIAKNTVETDAVLGYI